jgi:hypothetical protein
LEIDMPARNLGLVDLRRCGKLERTVADSPARRHTMADIARLSVEDARREAVAGRALLVCAYGDERCREVALEGSIPLSALAARAGTLPRDQPIIFYCA